MLSSPWCCSSRLWAQISLPLSPAAVPCRRSAPWSVLQTPKQEKRQRRVSITQYLGYSCCCLHVVDDEWNPISENNYHNYSSKPCFFARTSALLFVSVFCRWILTKDICSGSTTFTITAWANCQSSSRPKTHTVFWCSCFLKHTFDSESLRGILSYTYRSTAIINNLQKGRLLLGKASKPLSLSFWSKLSIATTNIFWSRPEQTGRRKSNRDNSDTATHAFQFRIDWREAVTDTLGVWFHIYMGGNMCTSEVLKELMQVWCPSQKTTGRS